MILLSALTLGYAYARLTRDQYARRRAYNRYTNFMLLFDGASQYYEYHWGALIDFFLNFDHTYFLWKLRTSKLAEWRAQWQLRERIMAKQSEGDEVSQIIMQLDNVAETTRPK